MDEGFKNIAILSENRYEWEMAFFAIPGYCTDMRWMGNAVSYIASCLMRNS